MKMTDGAQGGSADAKTFASGRVHTVSCPGMKAPHEVSLVALRIGQQALSQAERHRGVVGPLAWRKLKAAAPHHVSDGRVTVARQELNGGADRIANGEADDAADGAVSRWIGGGHGVSFNY